MTSEGEKRQHWAQLGNELESAPYWRLLGVRVEEIASGYCRLRLPFSADLHASDTGTVHPGALTCLIELAVSAAAATLAPEEPRSHYTVELSASFLAPATGDVVADGRVLWADSHAAKGEAELRDESGRLVAKGSATCLLSAQGEV